MVACGIVVIGLALSLVGALLWRSSERRSVRQEFDSTSANVTATLGTLLRRDTDFVATLRAVLTMHPHMSPALYSTWYETLQGGNRQPGGVGSAVVSPVSASELSSFERRRDADPSFRALIGRWLQPIPRGRESTYCLLAAGGRLIPFNDFNGPLVHQNWCTADVDARPESDAGAAKRDRHRRVPGDAGRHLLAAHDDPRGCVLPARRAAEHGRRAPPRRRRLDPHLV